MKPNLALQITFARLLLVPLFCAATVTSHYRLALAILLAAGLSDVLDGYVARAFDQSTRLGAILDPVADKLLAAAAFVTLAMATGVTARVPLWLAVLVLTRDLAMGFVTLSLYRRTGRSDFPPSRLGKASTCVQIGYVSAVLAVNGFGGGEAWLPWLASLAAAATIASGVGYARAVLASPDAQEPMSKAAQ